MQKQFNDYDLKIIYMYAYTGKKYDLAFLLSTDDVRNRCRILLIRLEWY